MRCYSCDCDESESDLLWCDYCDQVFCSECAPYRDDDAPVNVCATCCGPEMSDEAPNERIKEDDPWTKN